MVDLKQTYIYGNPKPAQYKNPPHNQSTPPPPPRNLKKKHEQKKNPNNTHPNIYELKKSFKNKILNKKKKVLR